MTYDPGAPLESGTRMRLDSSPPALFQDGLLIELQDTMTPNRSRLALFEFSALADPSAPLDTHASTLYREPSPCDDRVQLKPDAHDLPYAPLVALLSPVGSYGGASDTFDNGYAQVPAPGWKTRRWRGLREREALSLFLLILVVSAVGVVVLEAFILAAYIQQRRVNPGLNYSMVPVYVGLFIVAMVYQVGWLIVLVWTKNRLVMVLLVVFLCAMAAYTGVQERELRKLFYSTILPHDPMWVRALHGVNVGVIVVTVVTAVVQLGMCYVLWLKYLWIQNKQVLTTWDRTSRLYMVWQVHRTALVFVVFLQAGFNAQFGQFYGADSNWQFISSMVIIPVVLVVCLFADWCASNEILWGTASVVVLCVADMGYVLFCLVRLHHRRRDLFNTSGVGMKMFGALTLVCMAAVVGLAVYLAAGYGLGCKRFTQWQRSDEHAEAIEID